VAQRQRERAAASRQTAAELAVVLAKMDKTEQEQAHSLAEPLAQLSTAIYS
jgi:hypothetical protein